MTAHPQVALYPRTDVNYFVEDELDTRTWTEGRVDSARWERDHDRDGYARMFAFANGKPAIGHKGADLLYWRPAHARLARFVPGVKLIVTLRDPVSRAWSQYWNEVGKGRETLGFEEALASELQRRSSDFGDFHLAYTTRGFYAESLEHLFRHIDRSQILVLTVEHTRAHAREVMQEIYRFIGVDPESGLESAGKRANENWTTVPKPWVNGPVLRALERGYTRVVEAVVTRATRNPERRRNLRKELSRPFRRPASGIAMPAAVRHRLSELYAPKIRDLERLLGRGFPEWRPK